MKSLISQYKNNIISSRQLIGKVKQDQNIQKELNVLTSFLDPYDADIIERVYCLVNGITEIAKCPYCSNKAKWSGRFKEGYKTTCCSKECESKRVSDYINATKVNELAKKNRASKFQIWQESVTEINDDEIKNNILYDKQLDAITNPDVKSYLETRYNDSNSLWETLHRIRIGMEEKPKCPVCGKPVIFVGRKDRLTTQYCSTKCAAHSDAVAEKKKETLKKNWGTENYTHSEKYRKKNLEKYGAEYTWQREDVKQKRKETCLKKYGTETPSALPEIQQKVWETTKKNMSGCTSNEEQNILKWLTDAGFNVIHHYKSDEYPFNCDFYLPDYNLYIEYNGSFFHHKYAFLGTPEDNDELVKLKKEADILINNGGNPKVLGIIDTWGRRDIIKRMHAADNKLNFLEIYDAKDSDALLKQINMWIHCFKNEKLILYSDEYLKKQYQKCMDLNVSDLGLNYTLGVDIIKIFQENVYYKVEKEIFASEPITRRKLIQNRMKYLNKKEHELTSNDLLAGFKKSGIYYGYSHFNPEWTNWFVNKFNIKTIYDPCGGWGHHFLGMLKCDKIIYNEINPETVVNVQKMKDYFSIDNLEIHNGDGTEYIPEDVDAFFMCPPYYNIERYGNDFKNLDEYKSFLNKIFDIWHQNKAKVFGVVLREDMIGYINDTPAERCELPVQLSHLVKTKKKFKEYFYIFTK